MIVMMEDFRSRNLGCRWNGFGDVDQFHRQTGVRCGLGRLLGGHGCCVWKVGF